MRPASTAALAASLLLPPLASAHAAAGDVEVSLTTEANAFLSDSVGATTRDGLSVTPGVRVGWSVIDPLTLELGWRALVTMSRADRGYELATSGDALVVGARWALGLHPNVDLAFALELEALHADFDLAVGGTTAAGDPAGAGGTTDDWSFGAIPKVIGSARLPIGDVDLELRAFVGFAARTNLSASHLRLAADAPRSQVEPLDLGHLNLSGLVFGTTFALIF